MSRFRLDDMKSLAAWGQLEPEHQREVVRECERLREVNERLEWELDITRQTHAAELGELRKKLASAGGPVTWN